MTKPSYSDTLTIEMDPDSLQANARENVTGTVVWRINGVAFPGEEWNDFITVVAGWWLKEAIALFGGSTCAAFGFMDGPFAIDVRVHADDLVCRCEKRGKQIARYNQFTLSRSQLAHALIQFASRLHAAAVSKDISLENVDLDVMTERLRHLLRKN